MLGLSEFLKRQAPANRAPRMSTLTLFADSKSYT
jgi:hypothetical protein